MEKRKIIFGTYDTAAHGWTLTGWELSPAEPKTKYLEKPNGDGSWDLSTALTDGVLRYGDRSLKATFECSEGTRRERETLIREMVNGLDGMKAEIRLPDDDTHHLIGRLHVVRDYNDLAHAAVVVTAVCEPWKYADTETIIPLPTSQAGRVVTLTNSGRRVLAPLMKADGGTVTVILGAISRDVPADGKEYQWPDLQLLPGETPISYHGSGSLLIWYREAVLE